jgi:hypothetical protein
MLDERNVLNEEDCEVLGSIADGWLPIAGLGELDGVVDDLFGVGESIVRCVCVIFLMGRRDAIPKQNRFAARTMMFVGGRLVAASGKADTARSFQIS